MTRTDAPTKTSPTGMLAREVQVGQAIVVLEPYGERRRVVTSVEVTDRGVVLGIGGGASLRSHIEGYVMVVGRV